MSDVHIPEFDDTREAPWSEPTLSDFIDAKDLPGESWDDLNTDEQMVVSDAYVWTETEFPPEQFSQLTGPVVDPEGNLVLNALQNAKARAEQIEGVADEDIQEGLQVINDLAEENFPESDFEPVGDEEEENSDETEEELDKNIATQTDTDMSEIKEYFNEQKEKNNGYEKRVFQEVDFRQNEQDAGTIEGLGAVVNQLEDIGRFKEVIRPGAFNKTIKEQDVRGLFNHDPNFVIGRTSSGTLELEEREDGLFFRNQLPDTQFANDLATLVQRGDIRGASIGFEVVREEFSEDDEGDPMREVLELKLFDVGPVTFPAFPQTEISARSDGPEYNEHRSNIYRADQKVDFDFTEMTEIILRSENGTLCDAQDAEKLDNYIEHLKTLRRSVIIEDEDSGESVDVMKEKTRTQRQLAELS